MDELIEHNRERWNARADNGFVLLHFTEWIRGADPLVPGSWPHFTHCAPPFLSSFWRLKVKE